MLEVQKERDDVVCVKQKSLKKHVNLEGELARERERERECVRERSLKSGKTQERQLIISQKMVVGKMGQVTQKTPNV